jgi:hypothetical protein
VTNIDTNVFELILDQDVQKVDSEFRKMTAKRKTHLKDIVPCITTTKCVKEENDITNDNKILYEYAKLNKKCLVKIIKRSDKRCGTHLQDWYNLQKRNYAFCGGYQFTRLELSTQGDHEECPICLEQQSIAFIMPCGHCLCITCFKELYKVNGLNGTLRNLIGHSVYTNKIIPRCPICREKGPFRKISNRQIYAFDAQKN